MDATWIEPHQQARAENLGYMVVEPEAVIATHLNQILSKQSQNYSVKMMFNYFWTI